MKRVLCAGLIGLSLFMVGCGETNNSNTAKSTQQSEQLTAEEKNWTKAGAIEGIRLGTTLEKAKRVIGESPKNKKDINGLERYYFQNVTIDILNGKVVYITTETPQPYYNNKWHEGSSWRDIESELGNNYDEFSAEGMTMYEYSVASEDKKSKAIVRFAVKNDGKIDYISIRKDANVSKPKQSNSVNLQNQQGHGRFPKALGDGKDFLYCGQNSPGIDVFCGKKVIKQPSNTFWGLVVSHRPGEWINLYAYELDPYNRRMRIARIENFDGNGHFVVALDYPNEGKWSNIRFDSSGLPTDTGCRELWNIMKRQYGV